FRMKPEIDKFIVDLTAVDRESNGPEPDQRSPQVSPGLIQEPGQYSKNRVIPRKPATWHKTRYAPSPGKEGIYFARLLRELDLDSVPTFLVFIPEYIGAFETNYEHDKFIDDIQQLALPYGFVAVLDFDRLDKFDLKNPDYFGNPLGWGISNCHMVDEGARLFSRLLATEILLRVKQILRTQSRLRPAAN
ncbi:MAG: hypothetical protein MUP19_00100, partial [Candidatus Aminicenantes bacterium]|nr:hypothetical protein [Candidatus Aminicenantes bacterium]